jgi:hypothetical protein
LQDLHIPPSVPGAQSSRDFNLTIVYKFI